tara:strand:- start:144 stop:878 length:735 start_codon:yes stop_codon:yes gene_type:complete
VRNNLPIINVYKKKNIKSEIVTQLLFGDKFKKIKKNKNWLRIKNKSDNYLGYINNKNFPASQNNTHKIYVLSAHLYSKPNKKKKLKNKLSFGSRIKVIKKIKNFYKFDEFWIEKKNLKTINFKYTNPFRDIKKFLNVKYNWGGKSFKGVDCSGLVQLFLNFNNEFCPRDAKDQIKYFKKNIKLKDIMKNDLIFWRGHVAIAISKNKLIHAYGPLKKTVIMSVSKTIKRIYKTTKLKVTGIKRIN